MGLRKEKKRGRVCGDFEGRGREMDIKIQKAKKHRHTSRMVRRLVLMIMSLTGEREKEKKNPINQRSRFFLVSAQESPELPYLMQ